jgi:hypothetical protein
LTNAIETRHTEAFQTAALEEVQEEHASYFEALEQHPRLLVGTEVPALDREGMEVLRDANDAREWQEAVKQILVEEVRERAERAMDENDGFLSTIHSSVELFQKNTDLIPGTKEFDIELANRFTEMAEPYELRVEDKLQGYSIPVQPIIESIRKQLVAERAQRQASPPKPAADGASAPAAAAAANPAPAAAAPPKPTDAPQAGIPSKAGNSDQKEDFSTLFGTIGLPDLQI